MKQSSIGWRGICFSVGVLLFLTMYAQAQTPEAPRWPNFRREIGVDFNYFLEDKQGINLVIKHQIGALEQGTKWQKTWAIRFIPGFYTEKFSGQDDFLSKDTIIRHFFSFNQKHVLCKIGGERQFSRKRFRMWFGANVGFDREWSKGDGGSDWLFNGNIIRGYRSKYDIQTNTASIAVFSGCQYFFLHNLSIGVEINYPLAAAFSKNESIYNNDAPRYDSNLVFEIGESGNFPSLLYLSFHF